MIIPILIAAAVYDAFSGPSPRRRRSAPRKQKRSRKPTRAQMRALVKSGKAKPCACQGHKH